MALAANPQEIKPCEALLVESNHDEPSQSLSILYTRQLARSLGSGVYLHLSDLKQEGYYPLSVSYRPSCIPDANHADR
jgi:hypothetical protein